MGRSRSFLGSPLESWACKTSYRLGLSPQSCPETFTCQLSALSWTNLHPEVPRLCFADWEPQSVLFWLLRGNCLGESKKRVLAFSVVQRLETWSRVRRQSARSRNQRFAWLEHEAKLLQITCKSCCPGVIPVNKPGANICPCQIRAAFKSPLPWLRVG